MSAMLPAATGLDASRYIRRVLNLIYEPGAVSESRCLKTRWGTLSGYFNDFEKLSTEAAELSGEVPAVYITLNPVNPDLLARANNRLEKYAKATTGDSDIVERCWLPIDLDPARPSDISSTDAEKALAMERAKECRAWLTTQGFPAGVFGDSGNGAHLLYRIDLPNDQQSSKLIQRCLEAVAVRFTDDKVLVDLKNFNAARIWKLYGTLACKGDNMPDRPHRPALILEANSLGVVSAELLQKLAALAPEPQKHQSASNRHYQSFNLDDFIARHGIVVKRESAWNGGRRLILETCPWNPDHNRGEAFIVEMASGALAAGCQHNSCSGRGWAELREIYEPDYREHRQNGTTPLTATPNSANSKDEGVNVNQEPSLEEPIAPQVIPFPEIAWAGPFAAWRDIVFPCTEAPAEYLWGSCLVTIGIALGRNIRIENPRPLSPNFYALILGQTGDDRKSTALSFAEDALFHLGLADRIDVLKGIQSSEAIYESLARIDGARTLAYCDEFRSLLAIAQRKGQRDIIPRLGSLYYCPRKDSLNRSENSTVITDPFFSLIAATPAEYVQDLLTNLEVEGGFLNRFIAITGKVREWKAIAPKPSGWERFTRPLQDIVDHYDDRECCFTFTHESAELWTAFYVQWKTARQNLNERDRKLTARTDEHILKLALVYSAIEKQPAITVDALVIAISLGKWLQAVAANAWSDVGHDPFSRAEKIVIEIVKSKGKMYRRYLQQWVHKKGINGDLLTRVITSLVKNGHLFEGVEVSASGQKRPWVDCVPMGGTTS